MRLPLRPPTTPTREDGIFAALWQAIPKPKRWEAQKNTWISEDTWILVNVRVSAHLDPARNQVLIWSLSRAINLSLKADRQRHTDEAGGKIETILASDPPLHKGERKRMKG